MIFRRFLVLSALTLISAAASAAMYKWVDAEGNTHYTQSPPPGDIQAETLKPPPKINPEHASKQLEERKKLLDEASKGRQQAAEERKKAEQEKAQKQAECEQAKARLASYQRPRVNLVGEDGQRTRATEEQRQAELKKTRELIKKLCN